MVALIPPYKRLKYLTVVLLPCPMPLRPIMMALMISCIRWLLTKQQASCSGYITAWGNWFLKAVTGQKDGTEDSKASLQIWALMYGYLLTPTLKPVKKCSNGELPFYCIRETYRVCRVCLCSIAKPYRFVAEGPLSNTIKFCLAAMPVLQTLCTASCR